MSNPSPEPSLRIRQAVRALLITPKHDILLVRFEFPTRQVWAMPGGGIDPGEDDHAALHRELVEETGLVGADIGPHIWTREHVIPFVDGSWDGQRDQVHVVWTTHFEPIPAIGWEQMRAERVHEMRWWSYDEIIEHGARIDAGDANAIGFAPSAFPRLLRQFVESGTPTDPIVTGA